jgi:hypothetical protein
MENGSPPASATVLGQPNAIVDQHNVTPSAALNFQSLKCVHVHRCATLMDWRLMQVLEMCPTVAAFGAAELIDLLACDPLLAQCKHPTAVRWTSGTRWLISTQSCDAAEESPAIAGPDGVAIHAMCRGIHFVVVTPRHLAFATTNIGRQPFGRRQCRIAAIASGGTPCRAEQALLSAWKDAPTTKIGRALGLPWCID